MGSTPRQHLNQIPMPTRSTEAGAECEGRTYLSYLREDMVRPASFFILGDVLHRIIVDSINRDYDLDMARDGVVLLLDYELGAVRDQVMVTGSQRSVSSMHEDADRMITNWFAHVHPDSEKRHPFYDDLMWPPKTEVRFNSSERGTRYPVWGSIDAVFSYKGALDGVAIVDWKSGVKKPNDQFQLDFYRFGAGLTNATAAYHMLDRVRKSSIVVVADPYPGDTYIREAISKTERTKATVVAGMMPTFSPGWQCSYCPVQHICPADGDPRNRKKNKKDLIQILRKAEPMREIA